MDCIGPKKTDLRSRMGGRSVFYATNIIAILRSERQVDTGVVTQTVIKVDSIRNNKAFINKIAGIGKALHVIAGIPIIQDTIHIGEIDCYSAGSEHLCQRKSFHQQNRFCILFFLHIIHPFSIGGSCLSAF